MMDALYPFGLKLKTFVARTYRWTMSIKPAVWYVLGLIVLTALLYGRHYISASSSDEVSTLVTLNQWMRGLHTVSWTVADNFVLKVPFYLVALLFPQSRQTLFAISWTFWVLNFTFFWLAGRYFVKRYAPAALGFLGPVSLWLLTLSFTLLDQIAYVNARNFELGLSFLILALFDRFLIKGLVGPWWRQSLFVGAFAVGLSIYLFSDPYFVYVLVVPLAILLVLRLWGGFQIRHLLLLVLLAAAYELVKIWPHLFARLHVNTVLTTVTFVPFDRLGQNLSLFVQVILNIFNANFFGSLPTSGHAIISLINLVVVLLLVRYSAKPSDLKQPGDFWRAFAVIQALVIAFAFLFSTEPADLGASRYLTILAFDAALLLLFWFSHLPDKSRKLLLVVILLAIVGNTFTSAKIFRPGPPANAENMAVIHLVRSLGLQKGYADYWEADINTYLSNDKTEFIAVNCMSGPFKLYHWLGDDGAASIHSTRSFYLFDKAQSDGCTPAKANEQFGLPRQTYSLGHEQWLYVYDYDTTSRIK